MGNESLAVPSNEKKEISMPDNSLSSFMLNSSDFSPNRVSTRASRPNNIEGCDRIASNVEINNSYTHHPSSVLCCDRLNSSDSDISSLRPIENNSKITINPST